MLRSQMHIKANPNSEQTQRWVHEPYLLWTEPGWDAAKKTL